MTEAADDLFDIHDKVVVVTGGMGQLGRQFTRVLTGRGAKVAILDLAAGDVAGQERLTASAGTSDLMFVQADIADKASVISGVDHVLKRWGPPHALINAAALDTPPGAGGDVSAPFEDYPEEIWDQILDVNVKGVLVTCQVIGKHMAEEGRGSIINISSIYGLVSPDQRIYSHLSSGGKQFVKPIGYSASKSALFNITRYLATYWAPRNVRVNTLTPGGVFNGQDDQFVAAYSNRVPLGRMADEAEYNGAIVYLVSDASRYMTGSNMVIDGGWTAW